MTGCIELFHTKSWKGAVAVVGVAALVMSERERERERELVYAISMFRFFKWKESMMG